MIAPFAYQPSININTQPLPVQSPGLSRMFAAAVVNRQFCELLLNDPCEALQKGYLGEIFMLTQYENELIVSIKAKSLADLARQINKSLLVR